MKNFSKKLSFVMATAMVVTSLYAPQNVGAAAKNAVVLKGSTKTVKSKNIYLTGKTVDFDAMIKGKKVKDSAGKWTTSSKKVATVDKNGVVKVTGAGTATIKFTDKKSKKAVSVKIYGRVRASKVMVSPAAVTVKEGESVDVNAILELSEKVKAAGADDTTYKLFAESLNTDVADVSVDGTKLMVKGVAKSATPATIKVYAAQVGTLAKAKEVKIKATTEFTVKVNGKLEAKQSGANKITVMGTDLVASKSAYVLKNSSGKVVELKDAVVDNKTVKDTVLVNEAKTEVTLEGSTRQLPVGKYTLSYNGGEPVELEVVEAVVKNIQIIPSNTAIMTNDGAKVYYKVFDQFGDDVTKSPISANITVSGSHQAAASTKRGVITFTPDNSFIVKEADGRIKNQFQLNLSKVSVAVVDTKTGANTSAILTVGDRSRVWEHEYKGVYNIVTKKFVENISDDSKLDDYRLLFKVKDQYQTDISKEEYHKDELMVTLLGITGVSTINATLANQSVVENKELGEDDYYYAYKLTNTSNDWKKDHTYMTPSREGDITVQAISVNNGKMSSNKLTVAPSNKVDKLTVRAGADGVYEGQDNWLDFTALDANGKEITSWDKLKVLNDSRYLKNFNRGALATAKLYFVKKDNGKVGLLYRPYGITINDDRIQSTQILTFVTPTNSFSTATLNVRAQRRPVSIVGLNSGAPRGVTHRGKNLVLKAEHIRFQDQFGNPIDPDLFKDSGYRIAVGVKDQGDRSYFEINDTNLSTRDGNVEITGKGTQIVDINAITDGVEKTGSSILKLKLVHNTASIQKELEKTSDEKSVEVYNVLLNDMSRFEIKDIHLKAAAELPGAINKYEKATGRFEYEVRTDDSKYFVPEVVGYYAGEPIKLAAGDYKAWGLNDKTEIPYINENVLTKRKAVAKVTVSDDRPTEVTKEFEYSNEGRKFVTAGIDRTTIELNEGQTITWAEIQAAAGITLKDQYDEAIKNVTPILTVTDYDEDAVHFISNKHNGNTETAFTLSKVVKRGNENITVFTLKINAPGSNYTFEKVITVNIK
ncbi:MAG: Ig-like domain-containing protein [Catonella sp.]|uniref:Ig-like domain-containing protein n=1 Tax=Catonella sp. TaxID=2382125 RepID=UPI003FA0D16E